MRRSRCICHICFSSFLRYGGIGEGELYVCPCCNCFNSGITTQSELLLELREEQGMTKTKAEKAIADYLKYETTLTIYPNGKE